MRSAKSLLFSNLGIAAGADRLRASALSSQIDVCTLKTERREGAQCDRLSQNAQKQCIGLPARLHSAVFAYANCT